VSTKRKYRRLYELINEHYDSVIFILDEIDLLVGRRANDEPAYRNCSISYREQVTRTKSKDKYQSQL